MREDLVPKGQVLKIKQNQIVFFLVSSGLPRTVADFKLKRIRTMCLNINI